jgi:predicted MFS family arabinose efflux permease
MAGREGMLGRANSVVSLIIIGFLFISSFALFAPKVKAEQTIVNDDFTSDSFLNLGIWQKNGPTGVDFYEHVSSTVLAAGAPYLILVDPNPTFSGSGMSINSIDGSGKICTIESVNSFSAPLTLQGSVMATKSGGAAFCMWLRNDALPGAVGFNGVLNSSAPNYGVWSDHRGQWWVQRMHSSPQLNTIYQLTITVNTAGDITLSLSSNGQTLSTVSEQSIGTGPFKILLAQYEFWDGDTGTGPNQAYWKSVTLTANSGNINPSPSSSPTPTSTSITTPSTGTSPNPSSTATTISASLSPNPSLTPTTSITSPNGTLLPESSSTPIQNANITPSATSVSNPSSSPLPNVSIEPSPTPSIKASFNLPIETVIATIVAPTLTVMGFLFYRSKRRKKVIAVAPTTDSPVPNKLFLLGLLSAVFSIDAIDIFVPLLRPEVAKTFGISTSTAFQLSAYSAIAAVITGLALSAFSTKVRYKTLLMSGVLCTVACTVGVYLAPNFLFAQIFYALNGVGSVAVGVMAPTIIGELYPNDKKAKRISWIMVTGQLSIFVGSPVTGFIANSGGVTSWRNVLLWFEIPTTIICLALVILLVPNKPLQSNLGAKKKPFFDGFRQVLTNKSAVACLVSGFLAAVLSSVNGFAPSFLAEVFRVTPFLRSLVPVAATSLLIAGMLIGGVLVNRVGRKRFALAAAFPANIFTFIGYPITLVIPNVWVLLSFRFTAALIGGMALVAGPLLALDQVPKYRGTVMSLTSALGGIGLASGLFLGSIILNSIDNPAIGYPVTMSILGISGMISTFVILFFAKDPIKEQPQNLKSSFPN